MIICFRAKNIVIRGAYIIQDTRHTIITKLNIARSRQCAQQTKSNGRMKEITYGESSGISMVITDCYNKLVMITGCENKHISL